MSVLTNSDVAPGKERNALAKGAPRMLQRKNLFAMMDKNKGKLACKTPECRGWAAKVTARQIVCISAVLVISKALVREVVLR